jgi:hypothetical protein
LEDIVKKNSDKVEHKTYFWIVPHGGYDRIGEDRIGEDRIG